MKYKWSVTCYSSLNPEYDQAMNNLGNLLKDQGKNTEAEQLLEKAVELRFVELSVHAENLFRWQWNDKFDNTCTTEEKIPNSLVVNDKF